MDHHHYVAIGLEVLKVECEKAGAKYRKNAPRVRAVTYSTHIRRAWQQAVTYDKDDTSVMTPDSVRRDVALKLSCNASDLEVAWSKGGKQVPLTTAAELRGALEKRTDTLDLYVTTGKSATAYLLSLFLFIFIHALVIVLWIVLCRCGSPALQRGSGGLAAPATGSIVRPSHLLPSAICNMQLFALQEAGRPGTSISGDGHAATAGGPWSRVCAAGGQEGGRRSVRGRGTRAPQRWYQAWSSVGVLLLLLIIHCFFVILQDEHHGGER
jgi:hypothetical protein